MQSTKGELLNPQNLEYHQLINKALFLLTKYTKQNLILDVVEQQSNRPSVLRRLKRYLDLNVLCLMPEMPEWVTGHPALNSNREKLLQDNRKKK